MSRTLITDGFADDEWLEADDLALLRLAIHAIVDRAVKKAVAASEPMAEPADMTVLYVADCPGDFPRIWIRNDRKSQIFSLSSGLTWQREGDSGWYDWEYVLKVTKGYQVVATVIGGSV